MKILTKKYQMFLYAAAGMGLNMLNLMFNSYLCSALLVGGFGESAVKNQTFVGNDLVIAGTWAVLALIAKIVDGVIDIPMASFADRLKTRFGRRRPAILIGFVPTVVFYALFLIVPKPTASLLNTVYYGIILCLYYASYTLTMVTYYATFTEIVDTVEKRNLISNVKSFFDIVYFTLGYVVVPLMLKGMNVRKVAILLLPMAATMLIPLFMIREPSNLGEENTDAPKTVNLIASLRCSFRNRDFILWMIVYSFMTFGVQLFLGGINEYFSKVGLSMMIVMSCAFGPVPLTLWMYNRILRKKGFGYAFRYILITYSVSMLYIFTVGLLLYKNVIAAGALKTVLTIAGGLSASLSIGAMFAVAYAVPAQLAADEQKKTGVSNSAMYFAVQGLFSAVATGIGTAVVLTALKGTQEHPTDAMVYMTAISAAGTLLSLLLTKWLPKSVLLMGKKNKD